jgi:hypothetical protein
MASLWHWQICSNGRFVVLTIMRQCLIVIILIVWHIEKLPLAWPWAPSTPIAAKGLSGRPVWNPFFSRFPAQLLALNGLRAGRAIFSARLKSLGKIVFRAIAKAIAKAIVKAIVKAIAKAIAKAAGGGRGEAQLLAIDPKAGMPPVCDYMETA